MPIAIDIVSGNCPTGDRAFIATPKRPPVPLHRIPLANLMALADHSKEAEEIISKACSDPNFEGVLRANPIRMLAGRANQLTDYRDFPIDGFVCGWSGHAGHMALLAVFDVRTMELAGGLDDKVLLVLPTFRGRGIGPEILIKAFAEGLLHPETMNVGNSLTTVGHHNRVKAHRIAVTRALDQGEPVPPEVLDDYPELKASGFSL